jgi:hypothetical protein
LAQEEVAVVEGCGGDFDDDFVCLGGSGGEGDLVERVVDLAGFAGDLADGDCADHCDC